MITDIIIVNHATQRVYKAVWKDGPIKTGEARNKFELYRLSNTEVAVKKFRNVIQVSSEFLNEVNKF